MMTVSGLKIMMLWYPSVSIIPVGETPLPISSRTDVQDAESASNMPDMCLQCMVHCQTVLHWNSFMKGETASAPLSFMGHWTPV